MMPIFIIGYMGAGKSTLGRKLAEELGCQFIDTDIFIENRFRERIVDMFGRIGEEAFRRRERYIIEELSGMTDCVISTGGGLPCYNDNMSIIKDCGLSIYLQASAQHLAERLELCKRTRPSIRHKSGEELREHVEQALGERLPIYEQADWQICVEHIESSEDELRLAKQLAKRIKQSHIYKP